MGRRDEEPEVSRAGLVAAMRAAARYRPDPGRAPVELALPFEGGWLAENSPADRVPSHGTHLLGQTYAIDFVAVEGRRTAALRDWRTAVAVEPPERFFGFGRPILAPAAGRVVLVHDGEADHSARRSPLTLAAYALTQGSRLRRGFSVVTGNHVVIALAEGGPYVALAHLRLGSIRVVPGDEVTVGEQVAECGNSGNSTQPHVHVQVMDSPDLPAARGIPMVFAGYRVWARRGGPQRTVTRGLPGNGEVAEPLPASSSQV